jgi:hypothetical protein
MSLDRFYNCAVFTLLAFELQRRIEDVVLFQPLLNLLLHLPDPDHILIAGIDVGIEDVDSGTEAPDMDVVHTGNTRY